MLFNWHPDREPPQLQPHSGAKLDVLRSYLRAYLDRLNVLPIREQSKLDLETGPRGGRRRGTDLGVAGFLWLGFALGWLTREVVLAHQLWRVPRLLSSGGLPKLPCETP